MKKIFFFAAAMMAAISMNAEETVVYDWASKVGTTNIVGADASKMKESTVTVLGTKVNCIELGSSMFVSEVATNYVKIAISDVDSFLVDDIVKVKYCITSGQEGKSATLGVYTNDSTILAQGDANDVKIEGTDVSELQASVKVNTASILLGRKNGNTKICLTEIQVIRGGEIVVTKANKPIVNKGTDVYYDSVKVALEALDVDSIMYSFDNVNFVKYTDTLVIKELGETNLYAFSMLKDAENSDTIKATYTIKQFVARPIFNARKTIEFKNINKDDIKLVSEATGSIGTYNLDGVEVPSISYKNVKTTDEKDSVVIVSFAGRENVTFRYKNSGNKADVMKIPADFVQCDAKNFEIYVDDVKSGDTIVFVVTAKGSAPIFDHTYSTAAYLEAYQPDDDSDPCYTDGFVFTKSDAKIENDYSGWTDLVYTVAEGGHSKIRLKETANGFRLAKILVGAYRGVEAVENVNATVKAIKTIENGQLVIIKNGVRYNALGAQL